MYDVTIHRLRIFKTVVEAGGMGAAASLLGIAQPSVSAHIKSLEGVAGQPLFERKLGRSGELTEAGRIVYDYARDVVVGAEQVSELLQDLQVGRRGSVAFAATRTLSHSVLDPILAEYHARWPGVLISQRTGSLSDVTDLVLTGSVAFGLVVSGANSEGLHTEFLRPEPIAILASPQHPLASRQAVTPEDLANQQFVLPLRSSSNFRSSIALLRRLGFSYRAVSLETDDYVTLKHAVRAGWGVALLLRESAELDLATGELVALKVSFPLPSLGLRIVRLPHRHFAPSERRLLDLMRTTLASDDKVGAHMASASD